MSTSSILEEQLKAVQLKLDCITALERVVELVEKDDIHPTTTEVRAQVMEWLSAFVAEKVGYLEGMSPPKAKSHTVADTTTPSEGVPLESKVGQSFTDQHKDLGGKTVMVISTNPEQIPIEGLVVGLVPEMEGALVQTSQGLLKVPLKRITLKQE